LTVGGELLEPARVYRKVAPARSREAIPVADDDANEG